MQKCVFLFRRKKQKIIARIRSAPKKKYILIELQIHIKEIMDGTAVCAKEIAHRLYKEPEEGGKPSPELISASQLIYLTAMKKLLREQQDLSQAAIIHLPKKEVTESDKRDRLFTELGHLTAGFGGFDWSDEFQAAVPKDKDAVAAAWVATAKKINKILNLPNFEMDKNYPWTNTALSVDELRENAMQMAPRFKRLCTKVAKSQPGCSVNFGPGDNHMIKEKKSLQDKIAKDSKNRESGTMKFMSELLAKTGKSLSAITDGGLADLRCLAGLESLDLSGCEEITDSDLARLRNAFPGLKSLCLSGCKQITDSGLYSLKGLNLQSLNLSYCRWITGWSLGGFPALQSLNLFYCHYVNDSGLASLGSLTALQSLDLVDCYLITDNGLDSLTDLAAMQSLNLSGCDGITNSGLASIGSLTALESLNLVDCKITNDGLDSLRGLVALKSLNLARCNGIYGWSSLSDLPALQSLSLAQCFVNGGLDTLRDFPALQSLSLYGCHTITDSDLDSLSDLSTLQALCLNGCDEITETALNKLRIRGVHIRDAATWLLESEPPTLESELSERELEESDVESELDLKPPEARLKATGVRLTNLLWGALSAPLNLRPKS